MERMWGASWAESWKCVLSFLGFKNLSMFICWWGTQTGGESKRCKRVERVAFTVQGQEGGEAAQHRTRRTTLQVSGKGSSTFQKQELRWPTKDSKESDRLDFCLLPCQKSPHLWRQILPKSGMLGVNCMQSEILLSADTRAACYLSLILWSSELPQHEPLTFWRVFSHPGTGSFAQLLQLQVASRVACNILSQSWNKQVGT